PKVVRYCNCKREFCSGRFRKGEDARAAEGTGPTQEEKLDETVDTPNEDEKNTVEGEVNNDDEVSKAVSDSNETASQTDEENDIESEERTL
uniref:Uncharacterized protein n=1 Tax=Parascaris univalens TaxID=6257 RepID=A0A915CCX8_PARUN